MRRITIIAFLLASTSVCQIFGVAQGGGGVRASYDARGRLVRIFNMNESSKSDFTCQIKTYVGVIAALKYEDDGTEPYAIIIQLKNGRRVFIGLDENLYQDLSRADMAHFESTLIKGKRVRVRAFGCGASGRGDLQVSSIDFL